MKRHQRTLSLLKINHNLRFPYGALESVIKIISDTRTAWNGIFFGYGMKQAVVFGIRKLFKVLCILYLICCSQYRLPTNKHFYLYLKHLNLVNLKYVTFYLFVCLIHIIIYFITKFR